MFSLQSISSQIHNEMVRTFASGFRLVVGIFYRGNADDPDFCLLGLVLYSWKEKCLPYMQIRLGPESCWSKGIFQTLADTLKLIFKEGLRPKEFR